MAYAKRANVNIHKTYSRRWLSYPHEADYKLVARMAGRLNRLVPIDDPWYTDASATRIGILDGIQALVDDDTYWRQLPRRLPATKGDAAAARKLIVEVKRGFAQLARQFNALTVYDLSNALKKEEREWIAKVRKGVPREEARKRLRIALRSCRR